MLMWIPNYHGYGHLKSNQFDVWTNLYDLNNELLCSPPSNQNFKIEFAYLCEGVIFFKALMSIYPALSVTEVTLLNGKTSIPKSVIRLLCGIRTSTSYLDLRNWCHLYMLRKVLLCVWGNSCFALSYVLLYLVC